MLDRLARLQDAMRAHHLAAIAVIPGANLNYLTGIDFLTKLRLMMAIIPADGEPALVVPLLEAGRASRARVPLRHYSWADGEGPAQALQRCAADLSLAGKRVGIEHQAMRVFELRGLEAAASGIEPVDATDLLAALRMVKDAAELAAMRAAVQIIEASLRSTIERIRTGMTEREVADIWTGAIRAAGSAPSFDTAVAAGPNGANPHHNNSDRPLQPGDLVVLDGGALVDGYASDITRTVAVGTPDEESRRVYALVQAANAAGVAAAGPGISGAAIDRAARDVIARGGYAAYFIHRTGHGLGLEVHEPPFIVAGSDAPLPIGATFTVEPGIYLPGRCGVRIEDDVVITPDGAESLTRFERGLISV